MIAAVATIAKSNAKYGQNWTAAYKLLLIHGRKNNNPNVKPAGRNANVAANVIPKILQRN